MITLEQLADALGAKVHESQRIYIWSFGYNTKKTKCKAYIYEAHGEFRAACYIECPTQTKAWIHKEEEKVKARLMERVIKACNQIINSTS